ncbi:MAG TPA: alpha/beta hydrolase [Mycobacteriales bacterium]|nr:alpha/beta hydrolase [Mycobacteriales bacterium]
MPANGSRFHVVEQGPAGSDGLDGAPVVLLLHGFPQFWWAWRHQLPALADAGYRAVAMDLRGYGGSDKPPRGYDTPTLAADVAGVIRSLGAADAVVVGLGWGGWLAWSMPSLAPRTTRAVAVLGAPHPLQALTALAAPRRAQGLRHVLSFQAPVLPERRLQRGGLVADLLRAWSAPGGSFPDDAAVLRYTQAMRIPSVAHCSLEYYRWAVRSRVRPDGLRFARAVRRTTSVPVLQLHGSADGQVSPGVARGSSRFVRGSYRWEMLDGPGHFLPEEAPAQTTALLLDWLAALPPSPSPGMFTN